MVVLDKKTWAVRILILIVLALCIGLFFYFKSGSQEDPAVIVLASTEESAQASLGGFISSTKDVQIETYSYDAEEIDMTRDIQSLIASFGDREVRVYGPALGVLHNAFINVAKGYPKDTVHFFIYENSPEVKEYTRTHVASLEKYIEDTQEISLTKIILPFEDREVVYELAL